MKLALAQYPIGRFASLDDWQSDTAIWVARAVKDGATLLSFPEYGGMALASLLPQALQQVDCLGKWHIAVIVALNQQYR